MKHVIAYAARITVDCKRVSLGTFSTPEKAAMAFDAAARIHYKEFANLNFPDVFSTPVKEQPYRPLRGASKYFGVCFEKRAGGKRVYISASISLCGKNKYLGLFKTEIEAAKAFDKAAFDAYGVGARLNFPEDYGL